MIELNKTLKAGMLGVAMLAGAGTVVLPTLASPVQAQAGYLGESYITTGTTKMYKASGSDVVFHKEAPKGIRYVAVSYYSSSKYGNMVKIKVDMYTYYMKLADFTRDSR